jgi:hypothetical protein
MLAWGQSATVDTKLIKLLVFLFFLTLRMDDQFVQGEQTL